MAKNKKYTAEDVDTVISDIDRVRQFYHIYIPDNKLAGALHLVREIVDNADDEVSNATQDGVKCSNVIDVLYDERSRKVEITDNGRGIPPESMRTLCEVLHSGAKFSKGDKNAYSAAGGMNGVGQKLANFLSDSMSCVVSQRGYRYGIEYIDGLFVKETKIKIDKDLHGTTFTFTPSNKYLKELDKLTCDVIMEVLNAKSECCPGLIKSFHGTTKKGKSINKEFVGLTILETLNRYNTITTKSFELEYRDGDTISAKIAFGYDAGKTDGYNVLGYCNYIKNVEGGTHVDGFIDGMHDFFKKYMDKTLSDKDKKELQIKKDDVRVGLCGVVILLMNKPEFKGQFKQELKNDWVRDDLAKFIRSELKKFPDKDLQEIANIIKNNAKARISALKAKTEVKKLGNRLSGDNIDNFIGLPISYDGDYSEIYLCEGLSAGELLRAARYVFQSIFKMRGKIDNVCDVPLDKLDDLEIINKLGRVIEMKPGRNSKKLKFDRYCILSDADIDGVYIRVQAIVVFAICFPAVIDAGRLFSITPPLYSFKENGKKVFIPNNRAYLTHLQSKFCKDNTLHIGKTRMDSDMMLSFFERNERYVEYVDNLAHNETVTSILMELICANIRDLGFDKSSVSGWDTLIKTKYSDQFEAVWEKGCITIEGIKEGEYQLIDLDNELMKSKRMKNVLTLMDSNLGKIYKYSLNKSENKISIYSIMTEFGKYAPSSLDHFKGLGSMSPQSLESTCMNLENQVCERITWGEVDKAMATIRTWHSDKPVHRAERKRLMSLYVPDIKEIST